MIQPLLPPDDLPPSHVDGTDIFLRHQLEERVGRYFFESCSGVVQALLTSGEWFISISASALRLVIECPSMETNWRMLNNVVLLARHLESFSSTAHIRICPPLGMGAPYEIRVDEISIF
jgi:hypothetical protein